MIEFLKEFYDFIKLRKKFWLVPVILILVVLALLTLFGQNSAVAPFIYTLF